MSTIVELHSLDILNLTKISKPYPAVQLLAPLLILTAGTGGNMTAHSVAELSRWAYTPNIHIERPSKNDNRSPEEHVANIRDVFGISMSGLATVLGVTRPTVYAWLKGDEPKPEAVVRIQKLSHTADKFHQANIPRLDKLVHRPIINGRSLVDIFRADEDASGAVALLKEIAEKEAQARLKPKGFGKPLRSLDDVIGDFSAAIDQWS
jgi:transcriptional regulator with XRE-family HTH domain